MSGRICALGAKKHLHDVIVEFTVIHTEIVSKKKEMLRLCKVHICTSV